MKKTMRMYHKLIGCAMLLCLAGGVSACQGTTNQEGMNSAEPVSDSKEEPDHAPQEETTATKTIMLGSSSYGIVVPESFEEGEVTEEEREDDMVSYYHSEETQMDFDIYQFAKDGYPEKLSDFVQQEAEEYEATEVVTDDTINGITIAHYRSIEDYDGVDYPVITYAFENGENEYIEIAFWLDGENAEAEAGAIINSLTKYE